MAEKAVRMDHRELRLLRILEAIEKDPFPSQRGLARSLSVSLGLVNASIQRMVRKGYFRLQAVPGNRMKYVLTPKGMGEKSRLECEYMELSFSYYKETREKIGKLFRHLETNGVRRVVFFGAGYTAEVAYVCLQEIPLELVAVLDDKKKGQRFLGFTIEDPAALAGLPFDIILVTEVSFAREMVSRVLEMGIPSEKVRIME